MTPFQFENRVAVITGAAGGIGKAMAERFARAGMKLLLSDVDSDLLRQTADMLRRDGTEVVTLTVDVAKPDAVQAMADHAFAHFGAVHLLCNNAGVVPSGRHRPIWEYPAEDWKWAMDVNLIGVVNGLRAFVPRMMVQDGRSHIVNTGSIAGLISGSRAPLYSVSKHAMVRATEALYSGLRDRGANIGVTILCPGLVGTRIYESERSRPASLATATAQDEGAPPTDSGAVMDVETVAEMTFDAVRDNQFYLLTTPHFDGHIRERMDAMLGRRNPDFP
ncbi:MAG: SDR family NAD(P)-dependent oxidoreductase [Sphingobium sp.]|uniref:SDR family NAD(P)-dependent oxidoreductase n=1 Tax=Sphingobium sp. TaxID=1912891 RepID=UPI0029BE0701|nr:SDR family NAD(P)-dependent oxidoreductase [Sphingobium sp.]MDX3909575.1 SDR family NAD(P)-dependent oxidoreductase [Sphingobium sp.]